MAAGETDPRELPMMDPRILDPHGELVSRRGLSDTDIDQVVHLLDAMRRWRETEQRMSAASRRYMRLGETDMRALRFLIAGQQNGEVVTPGRLAAHLGISTASTTKLLDRLAAAHHIRRLPHPSDRRSVAVEVEEETRRAARETVGRAHARRFDVAAGLEPHKRAVVTGFLEQLIATAGAPAVRESMREDEGDGEADDGRG